MMTQATGTFVPTDSLANRLVLPPAAEENTG
jgi:hypothetical protein